METTKPTKPKQQKLKGFTEIEDDEVENLAERYRDERDAWLSQQKVALETEGQLLKAVEKNKKILAAAKAHPKGKVKVGDVLLTIRAKDPTLKIKVKPMGDLEEESGSESAEDAA